MKQLLLYLINPCIPLLVYVVGCNSSFKNESTINNITQKKVQHTIQNASNNDSIENYTKVKAFIHNEKNKLITYYKNNPTYNYEKASKKFIDLFDTKMTPIWLGTTWNFNGTTKTPKTGTIACGYFVTTTLYDMGIKIDIAKYAQCGSDIMTKHLIDKKNYTNLSNLSFDNFITTLKNKKPFLAIVGLDYHTGYILNNGKDLFFIHSSYINNRGVIKQIAAQSGELKGSKWKSIGYITDDKKFMENWLSN
jgi:hypothetical protein